MCIETERQIREEIKRRNEATIDRMLEATAELLKELEEPISELGCLHGTIKVHGKVPSRWLEIRDD